MPSFKTASDTTYLERLQYFWSNVKFLLNFNAERLCLKWKFFRKRMAHVAVDAIAKRIVPMGSMKTCVAYGDWSRRDGIRGQVSNPVKELAGALRKYATVLVMNEFTTSKLCSQFHRTLSTVNYKIDTKLMKLRKRKGAVLTRNRADIQFDQKQCYGVLQ